MIAVLGFCQRDANQANDLIRWMAELGGCRNHECLLVADASTQYSYCIEILRRAKATFRSASLTATEKPETGWPQGSNALFKHAIEYVNHVFKQPFLWLEPDAIPLKAGWLDVIDAQYKACQKPFMGRIYEQRDNPSIPSRFLSGIAVYPGYTAEFVAGSINGKTAWDVAIAEKVVPHSADTKLIQWFWGKPDMAPTFAEAKHEYSPVNTFTRSNLEPDAVLFHRNKDGTLLELLRGKSTSDFIVICPFFKRDAVQMLNNMEWIAQLRTPRTHELLLFYEGGTPGGYVDKMTRAGLRSFTAVHRASYKPRLNGPNGAWIEAARYMEKMKRSWLWMEFDAIPLKADWIVQLQKRYKEKHKLFMGPFVPQMGHMNGTGVYPANTASICKGTMQTNQPAGWDCIMKPEMINLAHDCGDIYQHAWTERDGQLCPHGYGREPTFPNADSLKRLNPTAVMFHRNKDHTLIQRLRERMPR